MEYFFEGYELGSFFVDIFLVDFVSDDENVIFVTELYDLGDGLCGEYLSGGVSRVDDDHGFGVDSFKGSLIVGVL